MFAEEQKYKCRNGRERSLKQKQNGTCKTKTNVMQKHMHMVLVIYHGLWSMLSAVCYVPSHLWFVMVLVICGGLWSQSSAVGYGPSHLLWVMVLVICCG